MPLSSLVAFATTILIVGHRHHSPLFVSTAPRSPPPPASVGRPRRSPWVALSATPPPTTAAALAATNAGSTNGDAVAAAADAAAAIYSPSVPGARLVTLPLPMGLVFADAGCGVVMVEEVTPGGSAATVGGVAVGDVVTSVALPYGPCLRPLLPADEGGEGLDEVVEAVRGRVDGVMHLEVVAWPGGAAAAVEERASIAAGMEERTWEAMAEVVNVVEDDGSYEAAAPDADEDDGDDDRGDGWAELGGGRPWDAYDSPEEFFAAEP